MYLSWLKKSLLLLYKYIKITMNKWDSKKIAFISILIAMSISFVIIGTRLAALTSFPSIKLSMAGLPIKIIGFTFGPVVGFIIGFITDIISFVFMPAFYFPLYSVALGVSGMLPGVFAILFNCVYKCYSKEKIIHKLNNKKIYLLYKLRLAQARDEKSHIEKINKKYKALSKKIDKIKTWSKEKYQLNFGLIWSFTILLFVLFLILSIFITIPQEKINEVFEDKGILKLISNKNIFIVVIAGGIVTCLITLIITRFLMKPNNYLKFIPVVVFVVITEYVNIPIIAYADQKALKFDFIASIISSLATSFIKIWFNMAIISFALRVVLPLINKKTFNGYE